MKEKYEKLKGKGELASMQEVSKFTATHKHICYHDEENPRPCKRVKL